MDKNGIIQEGGYFGKNPAEIPLENGTHAAIRASEV